MKNLIFTILMLTGLAAFAGLNPVLQNTYTTNTQSAADAHVVSLIGGPTNGVSAATVTNIVGGLTANNITNGQPSVTVGGLSLSGGAVNGGLTVTGDSYVEANSYVLGTNNSIYFVGNGSGLIALNAAHLNGQFSPTNIPAVYDVTNAARNATNGYPWGSLYDASGAAQSATNHLGSAAFVSTSSFDAAGVATATTNGYPWGSLYQPAMTAATYSITTNFSIPTYSTNWTVVLPAAATNYIVIQELYLTPVSASPGGAQIPLGGLLPCGYLSGTTYPQPPFSMIYQGDGKTFVVAFDGDNANFVDPTGQPYRFYGNANTPNLATYFKVQARFTWTIHK